LTPRGRVAKDDDAPAELAPIRFKGKDMIEVVRFLEFATNDAPVLSLVARAK
jgi:hypothetical protein